MHNARFMTMDDLLMMCHVVEHVRVPARGRFQCRASCVGACPFSFWWSDS